MQCFSSVLSHIKRFGLVLLALIALSGCSYFFGPKAESKRIAVSDSDLACMRELSPEIKAWSRGEGRDIGPSVDCVALAISKFEESTRGQQAESWSHEELKRFVSTYLDASSGAQAAPWLAEGLRWKRALLGGSEGRITRAELREVRELMTTLRPSLSRLSPYVNLILFRAEAGQGASADQVEAAVKALQAAFDTLEICLVRFNSLKVERPLVTIASFSRSISALGTVDSEGGVSVPLAEALKSFALAGDPEQLEPDDWPRVARMGGRAWSLGVRAVYQLREGSELSAGKLRFAEEAIDEFEKFLREAVAAHGWEGIPVGSIQTLVNEAEASGYLGKALQASTLNAYLPVVFSKILYGNSRADHVARGASFGSAQLQELVGATRDWLAGQRLLIGAVQGAESVDPIELARSLRELSPAKLAVAGPGAERARHQLEHLLSDGRALRFDDEGRLIVKGKAFRQDLRRSDLARLNLIRAGAGLVLRGYAHLEEAAQQTLGITEAETQEIYLDARQLGRELGIVDSRNNSAGTRTFMEGNIFLSVSNGDDRLSLHEVVEWLHVVMSGGLLADRIHEEVASDPACVVRGVDVFGKARLEASCVRRMLAENFSRYFENLPGLASWHDRESTKKKEKFIEYLEIAGRPAGHTDDPVDSGDLRALVPILHYDESVFATRDTDMSEMLESKEIWGAFPVIRPFIVRIAGPLARGSESIQRAIFSWLLTFGKPPGQSLADKGLLLSWSVGRHLWKSEQADRLDVLKIMASFGTVARESRERAVHEYLKKLSGDGAAAFRADLRGGSMGSVRQMLALFQCQPEALDVFAQMLRANLETIAPHAGKAKDQDEVIAILKRAIASSEPLRLACLPF